MIRVLVADDEPLARAGVRTALEADPGIEVVAEAAGGHEALELARTHRPDVALIDIAMPGVDGIAVADELGRTMAGTRVLLLTELREESHIPCSLTAGASGFLLKSAENGEPAEGVRSAAGGGVALTPEIARWIVEQLGAAGSPAANTTRARELIVGLTPREREILALLGRGLTDAQIARRMHVVEGTVEVFVDTILRSVQVHNRVQAALIAHEAGLVEREPV
ncbi:LuxR family two component transcriptional regulator [Saccharopolyspora erythraea NRRL 2338]|uniref:Two component system response regulator n=2 Tax=Saccharopolyspora erythraea TaxID=1836 RepID=A4FF29_SACEN|nr:response regulator transcription factor [Saccharopolyspora erythraea]EQD81749.1 LuxR family transcriptional regulator [Saccharopolyspora erythraea D]PFG96379.1 LuxR family two component transcriptional regulator [Saccharopolyspora erythraea NRRL 2338]QRK92885.1 response regulator transcription factor [Saccharopolyspora erythraea]CAM02654.1 two component system response regulator [Saccharopolyspora erythraea NRRL 2338]